MKTMILTSTFHNGFTTDFSNALVKLINKREKFVLVASDFNNHEKSDSFKMHWLKCFAACGINFIHSYVVDARMTTEMAQETIMSADVFWLSGGNTREQFGYIESYGLLPMIKGYSGVTIGMSAGSMNMAKTAVCTVDRVKPEFLIYPAIGLVDITVEPHYNNRPFLDGLLKISNAYPLHGISDDSFIIIEGDKISYVGDIFFIENENVKQISKF